MSESLSSEGSYLLQDGTLSSADISKASRQSQLVSGLYKLVYMADQAAICGGRLEFRFENDFDQSKERLDDYHEYCQLVSRCLNSLQSHHSTKVFV